MKSMVWTSFPEKAHKASQDLAHINHDLYEMSTAAIAIRFLSLILRLWYNF